MVNHTFLGPAWLADNTALVPIGLDALSAGSTASPEFAALYGQPDRHPRRPGPISADYSVSVPARAWSYRAATASQFTTFHHAAR